MLWQKAVKDITAREPPVKRAVEGSTGAMPEKAKQRQDLTTLSRFTAIVPRRIRPVFVVLLDSQLSVSEFIGWQISRKMPD